MDGGADMAATPNVFKDHAANGMLMRSSRRNCPLSA